MIKPADPLCISASNTQSWQDFADDVAALCDHIRGPHQICNLFQGRYNFMVGLAAAVLNGQRTVLPPSRAARALEQAMEGAETLVLGSGDLDISPTILKISDLPQPGKPGNLGAILDELPTNPTPIDVFTSGSTGTPQVQTKTWERLTNGAALTDALISTSGLTAPHALICTTPHQHMYGLEAAIFASIAHQHCLIDMPIFYPADLEAAITSAHAAGYREIVLASSPAHLRFLADVILETPAIRCIISATAPLPIALAERIERDAKIPIFEIYGSTETGSIAWRRTISGQIWSKRYDVTFDTSDVPVIADAPHFGGAKALGDLVELTGPNRFRLLGRLGDMISVAGKRQTLGALNAVFPDAPGISDGIVLRTEKDDGEDVLYAVAVRDPMSTDTEDECRRQVRRYMVGHFDPVFVPRSIFFTEHLERNETGKVTADTISDLTSRFSLK